jgi:RNA polymerase sigma factor (TIGR02999 family)
MVEIREILERVKSTGAPGSSALLPLVYDELRNLAARYMDREASGQTLQPTALVHEAWLRLSKEDARLWSDRTHFFRAAAQAMRYILVDRARAKARLKRGGTPQMFDIQELDPAEATTDERVLLVNEIIDQLEKEDPDSARVISLKFFGGLTNKEIAKMDGVTERTIENRWAYAKTELFRMMREEMSRLPAR